MSEIMLAVLRLPDNLFWKECPVARAQHNSIRKEAADRIAELEAENARLLGTIKEEPVAFEYQHEETGVIGYIDQWQIDNGFFKSNPRLQLIGPLYRHPPAREMSHDSK